MKLLDCLALPEPSFWVRDISHMMHSLLHPGDTHAFAHFLHATLEHVFWNLQVWWGLAFELQQKTLHTFLRAQTQ